jgi:hypothetical protein
MASLGERLPADGPRQPLSSMDVDDSGAHRNLYYC